MKIQTWDPKMREDYVLTDHVTRRTFSSCQSDLFVAEVVGNFPWCERARELAKLMAQTSIKGFFSVSPWHPGAETLRAGIKKEFASTIEHHGDIYGYFESPFQVDSLLRIRRAAGSFDSGEWRLGGCSSEFADFYNDEVRKDISFFLDNAANIGFLLELSEMQQALLLVKCYKGMQSDIARLLGSD